MGLRDGFRRVRQAVVRPKVDQSELDRLLGEIRNRLPPPVVWLLGKTGSGKTSIVRAITGATTAEIGNGFQPCTRQSFEYDFPMKETVLVRFRDTRGLGEVSYDPSEDLARFSDSSHLLMVVVRAMDHSLAAVYEPAREIRRRNPNMPVVVAQTCLHEGYPGRDHTLPYPFGDPHSTAIPLDLARSLAEQERLFKSLPGAHLVRFVPLDMTGPEDAFSEPEYGIEALLAAIEAALPETMSFVFRGIKEARRPLASFHLRQAQAHILAYATTAGLVALVPWPIMDLVPLTAIQLKMAQSIASLYNRPFSVVATIETLSTVGVGILAREAARGLTKIAYFWGAPISATYAAAVTYALGIAFCLYHQAAHDGHVPHAKEFRKYFRQALPEGLAIFRRRFQREKPDPEGCSPAQS